MCVLKQNLSLFKLIVTMTKHLKNAFYFEIVSSVAQLVEHTTVNRQVAGSSPARGAIYFNG